MCFKSKGLGWLILAYKVEKFGTKRERRNFSQLRNKFELSNLLEIQKDSFQKFLDEGIKEVFDDIFPVSVEVYRLNLVNTL